MKQAKNKKKQVKTRTTTSQRMREVMVKFDAGMSWRAMQPHFEAAWGMKESPVKRILRKVREAIDADIPKMVSEKRDSIWLMMERVFSAAFLERNFDVCVKAAAVLKDLCESGMEGKPGPLHVIATIEGMRQSLEMMNEARPGGEVKK